MCTCRQIKRRPALRVSTPGSKHASQKNLKAGCRFRGLVRRRARISRPRRITGRKPAAIAARAQVNRHSKAARQKRWRSKTSDLFGFDATGIQPVDEGPGPGRGRRRGRSSSRETRPTTEFHRASSPLIRNILSQSRGRTRPYTAIQGDRIQKSVTTARIYLTCENIFRRSAIGSKFSSPPASA